MSTQRYISTSFWDDEWVQSLNLTEKAIYLYLLTNTLTNIAGVYKITDKRIVFDTGLSENKLKEILDKFEKAKKAYRKDEYIILPNWTKHQKWETHTKIKEGIDNILSKLSVDLLIFLKEINYCYEINIANDSLSKPIEANDCLSKGSNYININSNIDSNTNNDLIISGSNDPPKKPLKKSFDLLDREPKNDIERVNKKWLVNYRDIHNSLPINPAWHVSAPLIRKAIDQAGEEKVLKALDSAMQDEFCLKSGYILKVIMSANVISRLINTPPEKPPDKTVYDIYPNTGDSPEEILKQKKEVELLQREKPNISLADDLKQIRKKRQVSEN